MKNYKATFVYVDEDVEAFDEFINECVADYAKSFGANPEDTITYNYVFCPRGKIETLQPLTKPRSDDEEEADVVVMLYLEDKTVQIEFIWNEETDEMYATANVLEEQRGSTFVINDPTMVDKHDGEGFVSIKLEDDECCGCSCDECEEDC